MGRAATPLAAALSRRALLGAAALAPTLPASAQERRPLRDLARAKGILFGAAVRADELARDPPFAALVARECAILTPGIDLKWASLERERGRFTPQNAEAILAFAARHRQRVRGHTLVWHMSLPPWAEAALRAEPAEPILRAHIRTTLGHFRGRLDSWDVVNEAIHLWDRRADEHRDTVWLERLGIDYVGRAFRLAREADPDMPLIYNDFDVEYDDVHQERKRNAILRLLERLKREGAPIDGFGIQGHLRLRRHRLDQAKLRRFCQALSDLGLGLLVTELDVRDDDVQAGDPRRDREAADEVRRFLDAVLDAPALRQVIFWGLSDRYTWLNVRPWARPDGEPARPLPFDADLNEKPMVGAIVRALEGAPRR